MKRFLLAVALLALTGGSGSAGTINVLTLNASRTIDFVANPGFGVVRGDLLNPSLFGPSGVVTDSVNFLGSVGALTPDNLAGADVVLFVATPGNPTSAELSALQSFVNAGGGLLVAGNNINSFAALVGGTPGALPGAGGRATVVNATSPLASGPFGNLPVGTQFNVPFHGVLSTAGPGGLVGITGQSGAFGISYQVGLGRVVLLGDEEIFLSSNPGVPASPSLNATTQRIFRNAFAYVSVSAVPEPSTIVMLGSAVVGLLGFGCRNRQGG